MPPGCSSESLGRPTRAGASYPVIKLADTEEASLAKWTDMLTVSAVNAVRLVKPGATVLLTAADESRQDHVVSPTSAWPRQVDGLRRPGF
jgi:hypothetical protein